MRCRASVNFKIISRYAKLPSWQRVNTTIDDCFPVFYRSSVSMGEVTGSGLWEKEPVSGTEDYVRYLSVCRRSDIWWGFRSWENKVQEFRGTAANYKGYKGKDYITSKSRMLYKKRTTAGVWKLKIFLLVQGQVNGHNVLVQRKFYLSERTN